MKKLFWALFGTALLFALPAAAQAPDSKPGCTFNTVAPTLSSAQSVGLQCDTNGQLKISGSINATSAATATAAAPTYVEGSTDPLSQDLNGNLRITGTINASSSAKATAAAPSYVEGTDNPFSQNLTGDLRTIAKQSGAWTISGTGTAGSAATGVVTIQGIASGTTVPVSGTVSIGNTPTVNLGQVGGATTLVGNGVTGSASQRVTIASDNTAFAVNATVSQATGTNLHAVIDTGSTTAVTQATAGNLNATVVGTGTFVTQSAITAASGSIASGAVASGAYASGAFASGSIAAGAVAAGATSFVKLEDVAAASADAGVPSMAIQTVTAADTATDGDYSMLQMKNGALFVQTVPNTANGATLFTLTAANSTNATNVKASAGNVYGLSGYTISATPAWLSLYNNSGTPTCGTSIIQQYLIPGSTSGAGFNIAFDAGKTFATGIAFCLTTGIAGTGSVAATSYVVNVDYK